MDKIISKATCIEKIRKRGVIIEYILNTEEYGLVKANPIYLKEIIRNKKIVVDNLRLTSDNRLVDAQLDSKKDYITRDIIQKVNRMQYGATLGFKNNVDIDSVITKSSMVGAKAEKITDSLCAILNNYNMIIASSKQLSLPEDCSNLFSGSAFSKIDFSNIEAKDMVNMNNMFYNTAICELKLDNFDTSKVTSMEGTFKACSTNKLELHNFNTSKVKNMCDMFNECKAGIIDVTSFNTSNVENMRGMFYGCCAKELNLENFDTSKVKNMSYMFCLNRVHEIDISNFKQDSLENASSMFQFCESKKVQIGQFNFIDLKQAWNVFESCKATVMRGDKQVGKR